MSPLHNLKIGFVGAGKMATALARGILKQRGKTSPSPSSCNILLSCPESDMALLEEARRVLDEEEGGGGGGGGGGLCRTMHCNKRLASEADVVVIAVKPGVVNKVIDEVRESVLEKNLLVVSIAAGITLANLEEGLSERSRIVRLMPNTPCLVGEGASVYSLGRGATAADGALVRQLLSAASGGCCEEVPEGLIDAVTGVSASGPAYMYLIIEALADGGVKQGLPRALALRLAAQTMVGAGRMVLDSQTHPAVLKDQVCSPGGTTIAALGILERAGLRSSLMQAVEAATLRALELGKGGEHKARLARKS